MSYRHNQRDGDEAELPAWPSALVGTSLVSSATLLCTDPIGNLAFG